MSIATGCPFRRPRDCLTAPQALRASSIFANPLETAGVIIASAVDYPLNQAIQPAKRRGITYHQAATSPEASASSSTAFWRTSQPGFWLTGKGRNRHCPAIGHFFYDVWGGLPSPICPFTERHLFAAVPFRDIADGGFQHLA
jgi:hypothetical protein